jgi:hypothetical protein
VGFHVQTSHPKDDYWTFKKSNIPPLIERSLTGLRTIFSLRLDVLAIFDICIDVDIGSVL